MGMSYLLWKGQDSENTQQMGHLWLDLQHNFARRPANKPEGHEEGNFKL